MCGRSVQGGAPLGQICWPRGPTCWDRRDLYRQKIVHFTLGLMAQFVGSLDPQVRFVL
jgi:hypothetical protein